MSSSFGRLFRITTFGESHGEALGVVLDGCPPGLEVSTEEIQADLDRRRPGQGALDSPRKEPDRIEILSGIHEGRTLGTPIALLVRNRDARPKDYESLGERYRPGHADYATEAKYGLRDPRGGGRASARETVGRVAAGAVARRLLARDLGVEVVAWVDGVGAVSTTSVDPERVRATDVDMSWVRCPDEEASSRMVRAVETARDAGDTIGGSVRCVARAVPTGWGEPVFDKLTADLGRALMSIPAARGFEIGEGFLAASMKGSEHNEPLVIEAGRMRTARNLAGGVNGGISNGESLRLRVGFKPPSGRRHAGLGRHDTCVAPRAVPVIEAMVLLVLADHYLRQRALVR